MNILTAVPTALQVSCWVICALAWSLALYQAPWRALLSVPARQHLLLGATLFQGCFWLLNIEVRDALAIHPLAVTVMVMVFGWALAVVAGSLALVLSMGLSGLGSGELIWSNYPVDLVLSVILTATASYGVLLVVRQIQLRNLFVYMLGGGFFGAMIAVQIMVGGGVLLLHLCAADALASMVEEHYLIFMLLMFPEGFVNGAIISALTVLWPDIVKTFDDHHYLDP